MKNKNDHSSNFINFGTYTAEEADILKPELEKNGIPVKVLYPGTSIGREATSYAQWTAYKILIPAKDYKRALEICDRFNIRARHKIPLPRSLYTETNRYLVGLLIFSYLIMIILAILNISNVIKTEGVLIPGIIVGVIGLSFLLFIVVTVYKAFKNWPKKGKQE